MKSMRKTDGYKFTKEGMRILPFARELCQAFASLENEVQQMNGLQTGVIRIGTFSSVATHWLPKIIKEFQKDYPGIDYEMLLGDYTEIQQWIAEGRVDCGFLHLPTNPQFEVEELERDELMAVIPENHPLIKRKKFPIKALEEEPFMLLEKGGKAEIAEYLAQNDIHPNVNSRRGTTMR